MKKIYKFLLNNLPRPLLIRLSYLFKIIAPIAYKGNNVKCPVCEKSFRKFLSYGSNIAHRENVLCPYDLTLERHRLMWLYLQKTDFFKAEKLDVLHVAPEQCFHKKFKSQNNLNYTTADLESPIADLHFDLHSIPLEDNLYDVIFCNHVMEHVKDDLQCMKELYRVMKPGGWGIFQVPIDYDNPVTYEDNSITSEKDREIHFWQKDHVRLYGLDYPKKLEKAGFKIDVFDPTKSLGKINYEKLRLNPKELIFIVNK
ncbi:MAG: SAM-dependent methyltransferase [Crocinitomicaceae bacterium]|nr:SAM-dependent methyltransferase [Crocinitomicaceae bacterium]|tara:strand:- start:7117 stop:7884 length:768 start_codon:yes stop_codon:yes gene_type:complete